MAKAIFGIASVMMVLIGVYNLIVADDAPRGIGGLLMALIFSVWALQEAVEEQ